jgi:hypothetical protein
VDSGTPPGRGSQGSGYPSDTRDAEWALIASLIRAAKRGGRERSVSVREVLNGFFLRALDGLPVAGVAEGSAAEKHSAFLFHAVGLGRHNGAHPSRARYQAPASAKAA